jgi:NAD(P)-dependent dehydrogenase (short-subunit alcohol dehydrogenase family)
VDITETVTGYLAAWNQTDAAARRTALEALVAGEARYVDPMADVTGPEGLDALIAAVQAQFAGLTFSLHGAVDAHHDTARFQWALGPAGTEPAVIGSDVITVGADGRITQILGFLDKVPADLG